MKSLLFICMLLTACHCLRTGKVVPKTSGMKTTSEPPVRQVEASKDIATDPTKSKNLFFVASNPYQMASPNLLSPYLPNPGFSPLSTGFGGIASYHSQPLSMGMGLPMMSRYGMGGTPLNLIQQAPLMQSYTGYGDDDASMSVSYERSLDFGPNSGNYDSGNDNRGSTDDKRFPVLIPIIIVPNPSTQAPYNTVKPNGSTATVTDKTTTSTTMKETSEHTDAAKKTTTEDRSEKNGSKNKPDNGNGKTTSEDSSEKNGSKNKPDKENGKTTTEDRSEKNGSKNKPDKENGKTTSEDSSEKNGSKNKPDKGNGKTTTEDSSEKNGSKNKPDKGNGKTTTEDRSEKNGSKNKPDKGNGKTTSEDSSEKNGSKNKPDRGNDSKETTGEAA